MPTSFDTLKVVHLIFWNNTCCFPPFSIFFFLFFLFFPLRFFDDCFKVFIEFVTILLVLCFAFCLQGMWDLSSPTRDWTCTPCSGRQSSNHWITREVFTFFLFVSPFPYFSLKDWLSGFKYQFSYFQCDLGQRHASVSSSLEKRW